MTNDKIITNQLLEIIMLFNRDHLSMYVSQILLWTTYVLIAPAKKKIKK